MEILRVLVLSGPNIWANFPVLEATVDIGRFEDHPSNTLAGFNERLVAWLPTLAEHHCSVGAPGGFLERLRDGTYFGHILEHVTIELQSLAGAPVEFGRARETSRRGVYRVVVEYESEALGRAALEVGRQLLLAAAYNEPLDLEAQLGSLREIGERTLLGPGTRSIVNAAKSRGIAALRLNDRNLVQLGTGIHQRRIWTAETDATSSVAEAIAQDKQLTRCLLRQVGVPVPEGRTVSDAQDAWAAAQEIGVPVVVKPRSANHGRGVSIDLSDRDSVLCAHEIAAAEGAGVVVERYVRGLQHRVLVVNRKVVAAARGDAELVTGDGVHSIEELVAMENDEPLRGESDQLPLGPLVLDDIALEMMERQGHTRTSVPDSGRRVVLHLNGDLTADVTDAVHPTVASRCVLAAETVGLDIAGVDVVAEDIGRPLEAQGGAVVEVNASPALLMHIRPVSGPPRPVGDAIVDALFPQGKPARIPIIAVSGTTGRAGTVELLRVLLEASRRSYAVASSRGLFLRERRIAEGDRTDAFSARRILLSPFAEGAIFEVDPQGVLESGLGFHQCDVAVITSLRSASARHSRVGDRDREIKAVRAPLDVVLPNGTGVLCADDPEVCELSRYNRGRLVYFGQSLDNPLLRAHLDQQGAAVSIERGQLVIASGGHIRPLCAVDGITKRHRHRRGFRLLTALSAVAAAWAFGLNEDVLSSALAAPESTRELLAPSVPERRSSPELSGAVRP